MILSTAGGGGTAPGVGGSAPEGCLLRAGGGVCSTDGYCCGRNAFLLHIPCTGQLSTQEHKIKPCFETDELGWEVMASNSV